MEDFNQLPDLPPEIWRIIFDHLPVENRKSSFICPISSEFRRNWWKNKNTIVFKNSIQGEEAPEIAKLLEDFQFNSIDLSNLSGWNTQQILKVSTANPNIGSVKFPEKDLGKREIKSVLAHYCKENYMISSLDTTVYGQIYEDDFSLLARMKNLTELNLWDLQDSGIFQLTERPSTLPQTLKRLTVNFCWLTPQGYERLKLFTKLEELTLKTLKHRPLQVKNFSWLEPLKNLRSLTIDFHKITPKKLHRISQVQGLTTLNLSQNLFVSSLNNLQPLSKLRSLTVLRLSRVEGVERCFANQQDIPAIFSRVEELDLSWCFEISENHIRNLGEQIKEEIAKSNQSQTVALKRLYLTGCIKVNDPVVGHLVTYFGFLENLSLSDCNQLSDNAFSVIDEGAFQHLSLLDVSFCDKLTEITGARIEKLPKLKYFKGNGISKKLKGVVEKWPETHPHIAFESS